MSDSTDTNTSSEPRRKVGDILRDERILRDEDLKDVAKALAIRLPFMEAIENSEPQNLPGAAYALGFVRSYADYLGLNSRELVEQYKEEAKELEREIALNFPEPLPSRGVPVVALLFIGTILAILFYGAWWYLNNQGKGISDYVPSLSSEQVEAIETAPSTLPAEETLEETIENTTEEIQEATEEVAEETVETTEEASAETSAIVEEAVTSEAATVEETVEETTTTLENTANEAAATVEDTANAVDEVVEEASDEAALEVEEAIDTTETETNISTEEVTTSSDDATDAVEETVETSTEEVAETVNEVVETVEEASEEIVQEVVQPAPVTNNSEERTARVYGEENTGSRVTLLAADSAWVEVAKSDGELTLTRLLRKGDRYMVPNESGLTMVTGNAGGVVIIVDGTELGPSGPIGAVRRDYLLDADALLESFANQ
ncbi:helix-turn-helix domain-containing protein [Curvivirga sp.]|uniref:helix-turn-helix domain-containing protein n=1 Tax=Curvivirga sp. TaxID=2856848 RepID=UPI003B5C7758